MSVQAFVVLPFWVLNADAVQPLWQPAKASAVSAQGRAAFSMLLLTAKEQQLHVGGCLILLDTPSLQHLRCVQ